MQENSSSREEVPAAGVAFVKDITHKHVFGNAKTGLCVYPPSQSSSAILCTDKDETSE